jgi:hypothetical protein
LLWLSFAASCYQSRPAQPEDRVAPPVTAGKPREAHDRASPKPRAHDAPTISTPMRDARVPVPDPRATPDARAVTGGAPAPIAPPDAQAPVAREPPPPTAFRSNLRVAFIGDQGMGIGARQVLELIRREGAVLVVHAGDLSYGQAAPSEWEAQIDRALGPAFPYLVAVGNHDLDDWEGPAGFAALLAARLLRTPSVQCHGQLGLNMSCSFRGLEILLSGVGSYGVEHEAFLESELARSTALVRLCVWHKNQHDMQVGGKTDEVGWAAYRICAQYGAPIITGHEHSYARTLTLTALGARELGHGATGQPTLVRAAINSTFVVVSGLGGHSERARTLDHEPDTWWASIYANDHQLRNGEQTGSLPAIEPGALFIDFNADGDPTRAHAFFKTVGGTTADDFDIHFDRP